MYFLPSDSTKTKPSGSAGVHCFDFTTENELSHGKTNRRFSTDQFYFDLMTYEILEDIAQKVDRTNRISTSIKETTKEKQ